MWHRPSQPRLPFLVNLNLPNFSRLMNDPVSYNLKWMTVPTNIPLNIPKFKGNASEDPSEHVTTFHLWCSSSSWHDDSICLRIFQCTLMGPIVKWYIELSRGLILRSMIFPWIFLIISSYPYITTSVPNSCWPFSKTQPCIFRIIFKNGIDGND